MVSTIDEIIAKVTTLSTLEPSQIDDLLSAISLDFVHAQELNRGLYTDLRSRKQEVGDMKQKTSAKYLERQNLQFEASHLKREVERCRTIEYVVQPYT